MSKSSDKKNLGDELASGLKYNSAVSNSSTVGKSISNGFSMAPQNSLMPMPKKQKTPEEIAKEFDELKKNFEGVKKQVLKKYKFTRFLSIIPEQLLPQFAEDENMPVELEKTNPKLFLMCIPEDNYKDIPKIKPEILKIVKESGLNAWLMIKTEVDLWNYGLDSKFDLFEGIAGSFPIHDSGFLGSLRVASIHKSLVLRKFERYVTSYVMGGSLVRGNADETSDVDTVVIIDDTDVKRMPRLELLEKLRGIIYDYIREATALAGVKNILNVQVWLMTDFWQRVKDAEPVAFTFIRDGVPMYDRGTFLPWKLLLQMGKIKPSPEAVDMFMKSGEQTDGLLKRRMLDAMVDIYWGIVTPTQALMMLTGQAPPEPKIIVQEVRKVLVDKEKLMSLSDLKILEKVVKMYKDYEHGTLKEVKGVEIDKLKKESEQYSKTMKDLRQKIEVRMQEHTAEQVNSELLDVMKKLFGNQSQQKLIEIFDKDLIKTGKMSRSMLTVAKNTFDLKNKVKSKKKLSFSEMHKLSSDALVLINSLNEYSQRRDLIRFEKRIIPIKSGAKMYELAIFGDKCFIIGQEGISKLKGNYFVSSNREEFETEMKKADISQNVLLSNKVLEIVSKKLGDFEIVL